MWWLISIAGVVLVFFGLFVVSAIRVASEADRKAEQIMDGIRKYK